MTIVFVLVKKIEHMYGLNSRTDIEINHYSRSVGRSKIVILNVCSNISRHMLWGWLVEP